MAVRREGDMGYWIAALLLIAFGLLGILSIGLPFLALGFTLVILAPVRRRRYILWPAIAAVVAFFVAYGSVTPMYCGATATPQSSSAAVCRSLIGIAHVGDGSDIHVRTPALLAAALIAPVAALGAAFVLRRRDRLTAGVSHR